MCWELSQHHESMISFKSLFFGLVEDMAMERTEWPATLAGSLPGNS